MMARVFSESENKQTIQQRVSLIEIVRVETEK